MSPFATYFSLIISAGAIGMQVLAVIIFGALIFKKDWQITRIIRPHATALAFVTALSAALGSLVYSEIIGFAPCTLCYLQRALLYPQVFLLGYLLVKDNALIRKASFLLSSAGATVAVYHYYGQMWNDNALNCDIGADGASLCSQMPFVEFGYITIPMLSLCAFALILALLLLSKRNKQV